MNYPTVNCGVARGAILQFIEVSFGKLYPQRLTHHFDTPGFNPRFTDILASIDIEQLKMAPTNP